MQKDEIKILAISGSLRANSSNHKLLNKIASMIPGDIDFTVYKDLGNLPHFNDEENYEIVHQWRSMIQEADGILICTPEYAFGVPGSLKNALDWTVSSGDFYDKPVALITASSAGDKAHASLLQTLTALTAIATEESTLLIPFIRSKFNDKGEPDETTTASLQIVLDALLKNITEKASHE